jgi:hypothetical protein
VATGSDRRGQERHSLKIDGPLKQLDGCSSNNKLSPTTVKTTSDVASAHTS